MSLDVYLYEMRKCPHCSGDVETGQKVYEANITHNLGGMAEAAGIYMECWRPEEIGITRAVQLVAPLTAGLSKLHANPGKFQEFNSPNGWGLYEHFVPWVQKYRNACEEYPNSMVEASR